MLIINLLNSLLITIQMRDLQFINSIKKILLKQIPSNEVTKVSFNETNKAEIAFTYTISAVVKTKKGYLIRDYWTVSASNKEEALIILPFIVKAKQRYPKNHAKALVDRFNSSSKALESAIRSRNSHSLFSEEYHKWNEIIKDVMKID